MVYNKTSTGFTMDVWNAASAYPNITCTINWIAIPLQYSVSQDADWVALNQFIKYKKTGNIVTVTGTSSGGFGFGGNDKYGTVGTLPSKYCPSIDIPFVFHSMGGSSYNKSALIDHNGDIKLYDRGNYINYWGFCVSYPIQYSVSQWCLIAHNSGTSYAPYSADDLSKYKMVSLVAATKDYRPLASTVFMIDFLTMYCTSADKAAACVYAPEPNAYSANVYYQNSKIYIKSTSTWDTALLIAF